MATEDMARQTEAITTNVEENSRAIDRSADAISEIARVADELNKIVNMFKV
jgi:methyl-accepting chemotaxis protein